MSKRDEFSSKVKSIIAGRAGYQCSFPGCNRVLIGPGKSNDEIICIGECAHIYSAATGGPRGKDVLSKESIGSADNGIYLCRNHHKIIDSNRGNEYSPSLLLSFKAMQEAMIARQLGKGLLLQNWVKGIRLRCDSVYNNELYIRLGKVTHFFGNNNSGKTVFCNCISDAINGTSTGSSRYSFRIGFDINSVAYKDKELLYKSDGLEGKRYSLDNSSFPICPISFKAIYLSKAIKFTRDNVSDISRCFGIDEEIILSVLHDEYFDRLSTKKVELRILRNKPYLVRKISITNREGLPIDLEDCSSSEVSKFLTDIGIILSRYFSYQATVLLIIDWCSINTLDDKNMNEILTLLESNENLFQTILISPDEIPRLNWRGWAFAKFQNTVPNTVIEQDEF